MDKKNNKKVILLISCVVAMALVGLVYIIGDTYVSTGFSIQFDGIEKGINPDNTRFDYRDIASEKALKEVFQLADVEYKEEYKDYISVHPILPGNIVEKLKEKRVEGEEYTYFPNEFKISIKVDDGIGLDKATCKLIGDVYKEGYEQYFIKNYSYPFMDLDKLIQNFDYSKYDYPEYDTIFDNEFSLIHSYLQILRKDNPEFKSSKGYTFLDVIEGVSLLENLDLKKINALISTYELSKDVGKLRIKYAYMLMRYELEKNKKHNQYEVSQELLKIAEANKKNIIMPGMAGGTITVSAVNDAYDTLASRATNARGQSSNIVEDISYIKMQVDKLDNPKFSYFKISSAKKEVDKLSEELQNDILEEVNLIMDMATEYFDYKYENAITSIYKSRVDYPLSMVKMLVVFVVLFMFISILMIAVYNHQQDRAKHRRFS